MSRVGKMPIAVPQGVDVSISAEQITVKGSTARSCAPPATLVTVKNEAGKLSFEPANDSPKPMP
jgi:large subunit ribosomal protein L6